jgi:hypothetical protein
MEIPELSRRVFLRRSLHAAGLVAMLPGVSMGCAPDASRAPADLRVLDARTWAVLDAVADAYVPRGGPLELGARDVELARRIDGFLAGESPALQRGVGAALFVFEWIAPALAGRAARFSSLDEAGRTACVAALCQSRIGLLREVYAGLKELCVFSFYAVDATWPATGYDGPWIEKGRAGDAA